MSGDDLTLPPDLISIIYLRAGLFLYLECSGRHRVILVLQELSQIRECRFGIKCLRELGGDTLQRKKDMTMDNKHP